jgi:hypothetical protein
MRRNRTTIYLTIALDTALNISAGVLMALDNINLSPMTGQFVILAQLTLELAATILTYRALRIFYRRFLENFAPKKQCKQPY